MRRWPVRTLLASAVGVLWLLPAASAVRAQTLFIHDATVYTMSTPPVVQEADIVVLDGRVSAVGHGLEAPDNATVIEANRRPVTPALFAGITALGLTELSGEATTVDQTLQPPAPPPLDRLAPRPEFDVTPAYNPDSTAIPVTRIEGYGWTLLGAGRGGGFIGGQGRAVSLDGAYDSFLSEPVLFIGIGASTSALTGQSRAAQYMLLEQAVAESRDTGASQPGALLTPLGRQAIARFAESGHVVFSSDRASDILQIIRLAERNGWRAVISGGAEAWKVADTLAEAGVPVLVDPLRNLPGDFDQIGARLDNAAILHEAGVTVSFTGGEEAPHNARKLRQAAGVAVANGLPHEVGVAGLTSAPAAIFGLPDGHGTVTPGAPANLVLWTGDPLEVTTLAETVILNGRRIPMVSRQTLLRDRYLPADSDRPRAYIRP
ncbi:hypothetical protein [Elongatibacter sediminis]|uniref:Amidohydrolase n=1 Tax=Elongatibacter sediminis TaxID=3119006 RepID=A0AAW9R7T5_9GAMM